MHKNAIPFSMQYAWIVEFVFFILSSDSFPTMLGCEAGFFRRRILSVSIQLHKERKLCTR